MSDDVNSFQEEEESSFMGAIDSHVHFWQYQKERDAWMKDMKVLQKDYVPQTIESTLRRNHVKACVAVQADQSELETHFLVELAKSHSFIQGVVGWIDLQGEDLEKRLNYFSQYPVIKGWRHIVQAEKEDFLLNENFQQGIRKLSAYNYTYDILIYPKHLAATISFVSKFPDQPFVIDHCAKPEIAKNKIDEWASQIKELAAHPNVYCKLSGLFTEAKWKEWSAGSFYPYLDVAFEAFGTDRLMFGSDWPVMLVSGSYVQWKSLLEKYMETFKTEDKEKVFGDNARRFYKL